MKNYVSITNNGEIDINAFRLIGASTKRGDNTKIGFFGSGLKYAVAVLLRNNVGLRIFSGEKEIKISTSKQKLGEQEFEVIKFNNRLTSLTTDMGADWKLWYSIREIYCNAIDEGGAEIQVTNEVKPKKDKTIFYLDINKVNDVFVNWDNYFSDKRTDIIYDSFSTKFFSSHGKLIVYRKGIQVLEREVENLFDYDFNTIEINESRTVRSEFELEWTTVKELKQHASEEMITEIFNNINSWEAKLDWSHGHSFSKKWLDVLGNKIIFLEDTAGAFTEERTAMSIILPNRLAMALKKEFGEKIKIFGVADTNKQGNILDKTEKQKIIIDECLDFLSGELDIKYQIKICDFEIKTQLGGVDKINEYILLSPRIFDMGKKQVLSTIIEEYAHLYSNADDKTRRFQNFLIEQYIGSIEGKKNIYL